MKYPQLVYVLVLSGSVEQAYDVARHKYPDCEIISLSKRELREGGWKQQLIQLRRLKGKAFLVFAHSIENLQEPLLLKLTIMVHRCKETIIADSHGRLQVFGGWAKWTLLPEAGLSMLADTFVLL